MPVTYHGANSSPLPSTYQVCATVKRRRWRPPLFTMSLRKRRGELRGDTFGDVASLGGSSSRRMCSLKVRMQGSGSGALSSFADILMDADDGAGAVSVSSSLVRAIFGGNYVMRVDLRSRKTSCLLAVLGLPGILALARSFACALSATDTLRGGFVSAVTPASWEKKKHASRSVLCKHDLPSPTPFYLLLYLIEVIWLMLDVAVSTPLRFTHADFPPLWRSPWFSHFFQSTHTLLSCSIQLQGPPQKIMQKGAESIASAVITRSVSCSCALYTLTLPWSTKLLSTQTAERKKEKKNPPTEKALQGGTPKSVASGRVFIENKQHNWTHEKRHTDSDSRSSAPSASRLVRRTGCLGVEAMRGGFILMIAFGLSQLSASQDGNKDRGERKKIQSNSSPGLAVRER